MHARIILMLLIFPLLSRGQNNYDSILKILPIHECCLVYQRTIHFDNAFTNSQLLNFAGNALSQNSKFTTKDSQIEIFDNKLNTTIYYTIRSQSGIVKANFLCRNTVSIEAFGDSLNIKFFNFWYRVKIGVLVPVSSVIQDARSLPEFAARSSKKFLTDWNNYTESRLHEIVNLISTSAKGPKPQ